MTLTAREIWHEGEIALQRSVGLDERMQAIGGHAIRDTMTEQQRAFFTRLPFAAIGTLDRDNRPWAGIVCAEDGPLSAPDEHSLLIRRRRTAADPLERGLLAGKPIAMLGIEPATRRRSRANGRIVMAGRSSVSVAVEQAFGNCPQYIVRRTLIARTSGTAGLARTSTSLDEAMRGFISRADTFFVATSTMRADRRIEADVSHRGGPPGFVAVNAEGVLHIPDFAGNNYFNTLGNIVSSGRAGLVFPDFQTGDLLQLTGEARVFGVDRAMRPDFPWDRFWTVVPREMVWRPGALEVVEATTPHSSEN